MKKKTLLRPTALTLLASSLSLGSPSLYSDQLPNILLIVAEDMSLEINPYMEVPFKTPGFDRLAAEGAVFETAWATQASCSPSRASIFTGLYPHQNGQIGLRGRGSRIHPNTPTYVDALREANYFTAVTYKLHFEPEPEFDIGPRNTAALDPRELIEVTENVITTAGERNQPWFLMLNTFDTHGVSPDWARGLNNIWASQYRDQPSDPLAAHDVIIPPYMANSEVYDPHPNFMDNIAGYFNAIRRVDSVVEGVLDLLDEKGLRENTIIIFTADHGPALPRGKQMNYNVSLQVPFFIVAPEAEPGTRRSEMISLIDLMPTIIEYAGGTVPPLESDARSLQRTLQGQVPPRSVLAGQFFQHWGPGGFFPSYAVRTDDYKIIHNPRIQIRRGRGEYQFIEFMQALPNITDEYFARAIELAFSPPEFELYDMENDPWEFTDLSSSPDHQSILEEMKNTLELWRQDQNDPFLDEEVMEKMILLHMDARRQISGLDREEQQAILDRKADSLGALMRGEMEDFADISLAPAAQANPPIRRATLNSDELILPGWQETIGTWHQHRGGFLTEEFQGILPKVGNRFYMAVNTPEHRGIIITLGQDYEPGTKLTMRFSATSGPRPVFRAMTGFFFSDPELGENLRDSKLATQQINAPDMQSGEWGEWVVTAVIGNDTKNEKGENVIGKPIQFKVWGVPGNNSILALDAFEITISNP